MIPRRELIPSSTVTRRCAPAVVGGDRQSAGMDDGTPFIGSEALAAGALTPHELRRYYRAVMPNVYLGRRVEPTLRQRTQAAWLWSGRSAVVAGLSASALHGAKWVDDGAPVELIWDNARSPRQVVTRADYLAAGETCLIAGMSVTTPARTAFDVGRRGTIGDAVARVDSLLAVTRFAMDDVVAMAGEHVGARGLRQLRRVLDLADAGAESPRETWLRLLLIGAGYPRPRTQIPLISPTADGGTTSTWGGRNYGSRSSTTVITIDRTRLNSPETSDDWLTSTSSGGVWCGSSPVVVATMSCDGCSERGTDARLCADCDGYSNFLAVSAESATSYR